MLIPRLPLATLAAALFTFALGAQLPQATAAKAPSTVAAAFHVADATLQELNLPQGAVPSVTAEVELAGRRHVLLLGAHDVRAQGFQLLVHDAVGVRAIATPPSVTYRGLVFGHPDSVVAASLVAGQLRATIQFAPEKDVWAVQPLTDVDALAKRTTHVVYRSADNRLPQALCGTNALPGGNHPPQTTLQAVQVCEIAIDADYYEYQRQGQNTTNVNNDVTTVINAVAAIYKRDVEIDYQITTIIIRTAPLYTTTNLGSLLSQMASYWNSYHTAVQRDTAHMISGLSASGTIGVAYLGTICNRSSSYGVSASGFSSNLTARAALTAHELGHAWNAGHCDAYSPCNIMCSGLGGCSGAITSFATVSKNSIVAFRNSRTCLSASNAAPVISKVSPFQVQAFEGGTITLDGTGFSKAIFVHVGGTQLWALGGGFKIVSDTQITFSAPNAPAISPVAVSITDTNSLKSNTQFLGYQVTTPPRLSALPAVSPSAKMRWGFGAVPLHLWGLTVSPTSATVPFLGFQWLSTPILLVTGQLDVAGIGSFELTVPGSVGLGLYFYSQVLTMDGTSGSFAGNTNVTTSQVK